MIQLYLLLVAEAGLGFIGGAATVLITLAISKVFS